MVGGFAQKSNFLDGEEAFLAEITFSSEALLKQIPT